MFTFFYLYFREYGSIKGKYGGFIADKLQKSIEIYEKINGMQKTIVFHWNAQVEIEES